MQANQTNNTVKLKFESIAGTRVYELVDIGKISAMRGVAAEKAKRFASLNITHKELDSLLTVAIDGINQKQDIAQAISILHELKFRTSMICEENSLLDLAFIFLFLEGEDVDEPSEQMNAQKLKLVSEQPDLRAFFLTEAFKLAALLSKKQGADLLDYLEETKHLITLYNRHIPR
jgi:hypothetical protein